MRKEKLLFMIVTCAAVVANQNIYAAGFDFLRSGFVPLNNGEISNIIITNQYESYLNIDLISLENKFEYVKNRNLIIKSNRSHSHSYGYSLVLKEGEKTAIYFNPYAYRGGDPNVDPNTPMPSCIIVFEALSKDKAAFIVMNDTTHYGCGVDKYGYIGINVNKEVQ